MGVSERILSLRFSTIIGTVHLLSAYAPTLSSYQVVKDKFYRKLCIVISKSPSENMYVLGDLSARVGADHDSWPTCPGHHGTGRLNKSGQRMLEFCSNYDLCITKSFFPNKAYHMVLWIHPRSAHWHQLDFVITRRKSLNRVRSTRIELTVTLFTP